MAIPAMPQLLRLESDVESPLVFVQRAQEEIHLGVQRFDGVGIGPLTLGTLTLMDQFHLHPASPR
jgi:hypothetical protein